MIKYSWMPADPPGFGLVAHKMAHSLSHPPEHGQSPRTPARGAAPDSSLPLPARGSVAHNAGVKVRFTQSARRHRIGKAHAMHVINTTLPITVPTDEHLPDRLVWIGKDRPRSGTRSGRPGRAGLLVDHSCDAL